MDPRQFTGQPGVPAKLAADQHPVALFLDGKRSGGTDSDACAAVNAAVEVDRRRFAGVVDGEAVLGLVDVRRPHREPHAAALFQEHDHPTEGPLRFMRHPIAFDVARPAENGARNRGFESAARFINMHVRAGVPLENIDWKVIAPEGFELTNHDGNLELVEETNEGAYDKKSYLSKLSGKRQVQAQQAAQLLQQANQLLQAGEQSKARWAFNNVANQYALDAASNEDARVQLENLQTQQAIVGLNTRRQRLYINNAKDVTVLENAQLREAAADNPILQEDQLNFRPQELSQLLRGNSSEDNAVLQQIAGRLVQHQRTTEPAPRAILISLPEEGSVYTFARSVQVAENAPLELDLRFASENSSPVGPSLLVLGLVGALAATFARLQFKTVSE